MSEKSSMENDYLELISGYLMNHFYEYNSYEEGVESAVNYVNSNPDYLAEMKEVFEYILQNEFPENCLRDIVRGYGNYSVSSDESAKQRLSFIYEDTIIQIDHDEIIDWEALCSIGEVTFVPGEMKVEEIISDIFNAALSYEERVKALISYSESGDEQIFEILAKTLEEKEPGIRSVGIFLLGNTFDDRAIEYLVDILKHDPVKSVRNNAVTALEKYKTNEVIEVLKEQLEAESSESVKYSIRRLLFK